MSRVARKILTLMLLLCLAWQAASAADMVESNGLRYMVQNADSTACLVAPVEGYDSESVVIPAMVGICRVRSIASGAFAHCNWLVRLSLPSTIEEIGEGAFDGCDNLAVVLSHVADAAMVTGHLPAGAQVWVDAALVEAYSQVGIRPATLIDVDSVHRSANLCDVNHDGVVNATDVTVVYNHLLGYDEQQGGDADDDGKVTATDVTVTYDAILAGRTSGVGDKGYCFALYDSVACRATVRIDDELHLPVGEQLCIVAHDNERMAPIASGTELMRGLLPSGGVASAAGVPVIFLDNKRYNEGTDAQVVMLARTGPDTIYYNDVTVHVAPHVVTDTLRVLSIGNSYSLDALSYMPFVMKAVAPEVYLKLGVMYMGGAGLETFCDSIDSPSFTYFWSHGAQPWDARQGATLSEVLQSQPWDVIVLQQQSSAARDYGTYQPYLNQLIGWLDERVSWEHEKAWLITPSYPEGLDRLAPDTTSVQMFERIAESVGQMQAHTGIDLLLPCGTAIQNARTTPLDSLGDNGHLFHHLHLQDGIPCLIETYAASAALLARYGLSERVWADVTWVDGKWLTTKNIQEINGAPVGMSEANRAIARQCAIKALENPLKITVIDY